MPERRGPAPRQIAGTVVGRWSDEKVLIRLADARMVELPAPEALRGRFEVGDEVSVLLEADGEIAGWMLPARNLGVNMRGIEPEDG